MEMEFLKLLKVLPNAKPMEELFSSLCLGVIAIACFLVSGDPEPWWDDTETAGVAGMHLSCS
jgi:hypothetical protein